MAAPAPAPDAASVAAQSRKDIVLRNILAVAALVAALHVGPAAAGQPLFQPAWTPAARADLVRLIEMDGWPARSAEFAVDAMVARLERHADDGGNEFLPASHPQGVDSVAVSGRFKEKYEKRPGCIIGTAVLANPLRNRTAVSGMFCGHSQDSWSYDPMFLEVQDFNSGDVAIRTLDVTDIGKVRPRPR
jgi:hypothetical protein